MRPSSRLAAAKAHLGADAHPRARRRRRALVAGMLGAAIGALFLAPARAHSEAHVVPPLAQAEPAAKAPTEVAVLAGGCFWGVQGVYQHVKGVTQCGVGLRRRREEDRRLRDRRLRHAPATPRRSRSPSIRARSAMARLLQIYLLGGARPDPAQPARARTSARSTARRSFPLNDEQARIAKAYIAPARAGQGLRARRS